MKLDVFMMGAIRMISQKMIDSMIVIRWANNQFDINSTKSSNKKSIVREKIKRRAKSIYK